MHIYICICIYEYIDMYIHPRLFGERCIRMCVLYKNVYIYIYIYKFKVNNTLDERRRRVARSAGSSSVALQKMAIRGTSPTKF